MKKSTYLFWFWIILSFCLFAILGQTIEILIDRMPDTEGTAHASAVRNPDPDRLQVMNSDEQNGFVVLHRNPRVRIEFSNPISPKPFGQQ